MKLEPNTNRVNDKFYAEIIDTDVILSQICQHAMLSSGQIVWVLGTPRLWSYQPSVSLHAVFESSNHQDLPLNWIIL